ncbi:hypothetical protein FisN_8Hh389 [Fistulifera solaris]|uniref:Uncharacterized protein n=1 Tax=Fistulifera solaris TaxID=1519565 RepID=A0A1Z5JMV4_FISSO|nr:hypothetical protein FisN_8Hh389 [Fistulifera solaris]|eukprot:GAX15314.1 hypothetical protein FisN_8Hh389 [Fistulifera solaris]
MKAIETESNNSNDDDNDVVMKDAEESDEERNLPDNNNNENSTKEETAAHVENGSTASPEKDNNDNHLTNTATKEEDANDSHNNNDITNGETDTAMQQNQQQQQPTEPSASSSAEHKKETTEKPAAPAPPPPVMKGTLSCDIDHRRHLIRGMWNYENSNVFPPQPFELVRNLGPDEDKEDLTKDAEFHGSFRLAYFHTTSKGKQKERIKVIQETGVNVKFTKVEGSDDEYKVDGKGTNQFGIFHIYGTATRSKMEGDNSLSVVLRKRYEVSDQPAAASASTTPNVVTSSLAMISAETDNGPLPPPATSFATGVVCLRGKIHQETSAELGIEDVVYRISGMWSTGLDKILEDPDNTKGLCNRFEYEHKSSQPSSTFPVSGRYSGWFDLSAEDGSRTRINERDVTLKFRKNSEGYHNVEGKGSNVFGKYSITGTLTSDHILTIFRHFQPRKIKSSSSKVGVAPASGATNGSTVRRPSLSMEDAKLKLDDVQLPEGETPDAISPPANGSYSAVSRGVLRVNPDGSHSCQGKWAEMRDHFNTGQTSPFSFRLEAHFATEPSDGSEQRSFPQDSPMYRGTFQLKKGASRYTTVVDQQIVMKFQLNNQGSFNVHGKGINAIGEFALIGTLIMSGKTGGQVELYRMYPQEKLAAPPPPIKSATENGSSSSLPGPDTAAPPKIPAPSHLPMQRRESSRLVKLPSRLEDDDPSAQLSRIMEKCSQILRIIREKDVELGAFFSEPVDPVALGIPTYFQIVKEPMDLRTIYRKMEANQVDSPEEFARLVRLVFENAMTFNIDPAHSVHQAARNLLVLFNQKFRDAERTIQNIRRSHGDELKKKDDKKRRRGEELISLKQRRLEEAKAMSASNTSAIAALVAAAPIGNPSNVTRSEFLKLIDVIQQLQQQVVQTHTALAELCPGDESDMKVSSLSAYPSTNSIPQSITPAFDTKKKQVRRKSENAMAPPVEVYDELPLTLEEQELLTETINELPPEHLGGVIQILREAAPVGADEEEIDLDIDQLDNRTQRKLLAHVSKFVKKTKVKGRKRPVSKSPVPKRQKTNDTTSTKSKASVASAGSDPFFAFNKDNSESDDDDSDDGESSSKPTAVSETKKQNGKVFELNTNTVDEDLDDDDNDDDEDIAANWNMKTTTASASQGKSADDDDDWGAAREQAAAAKAREAERKAREEKMKKEAEELKNQRLADAAAQVEEIRAQREEEEAKNARLREQEAEEARKAAREALRAQVQSVEQTVDLGDSQRDLMKQYEQSFLDKDYGSASPSSDFGF